MSSHLKSWLVRMTDGTELKVPATIKGKYEDINIYGHQAVIERVQRTKPYKDAARRGASIHAIKFPGSDEWTTQF